jgi:hypothetical protein
MPPPIQEEVLNPLPGRFAPLLPLTNHVSYEEENAVGGKKLRRRGAITRPGSQMMPCRTETSIRIEIKAAAAEDDLPEPAEAGKFDVWQSTDRVLLHIADTGKPKIHRLRFHHEYPDKTL